MTRRLAAVTALSAGLILAASPAFADHHEQADGCDHGATSKPCRPDPQPTHGKDCETHGNHGGVNEDHCGPTPSPTTTGGTPSTTATSSPSTSATSTQSPSPSPSSSKPGKTTTAQAPSPTGSGFTTTRPPTSASAQTRSVTHSRPSASTKSTSTAPLPTSPRRSVPSSTVARLAETGFTGEWAFAAALLLLVGGWFIRLSRKAGAHR